jgi:hypothetical protein
MDDLIDQNDGTESMSEFFKSCVIGYSTTGEPIMSFKKMVKQLITPDFDEMDAREFLENNTFLSYPSMENTIILMDLD